MRAVSTEARRGKHTLERELQTTVCNHVGAGNQSRMFCKSAISALNTEPSLQPLNSVFMHDYTHICVVDMCLCLQIIDRAPNWLSKWVATNTEMVKLAQILLKSWGNQSLKTKVLEADSPKSTLGILLAFSMKKKMFRTQDKQYIEPDNLGQGIVWLIVVSLLVLAYGPRSFYCLRRWTGSQKVIVHVLGYSFARISSCFYLFHGNSVKTMTHCCAAPAKGGSELEEKRWHRTKLVIQTSIPPFGALKWKLIAFYQKPFLKTYSNRT